MWMDVRRRRWLQRPKHRLRKSNKKRIPDKEKENRKFRSSHVIALNCSLLTRKSRSKKITLISIKWTWMCQSARTSLCTQTIATQRSSAFASYARALAEVSLSLFRTLFLVSIETCSTEWSCNSKLETRKSQTKRQNLTEKKDEKKKTNKIDEEISKTKERRKIWNGSD